MTEDVLKKTAEWAGRLHENKVLNHFGITVCLCYPGGHKPDMDTSVVTDSWDWLQEELQSKVVADHPDKSKDAVGTDGVAT